MDESLARLAAFQWLSDVTQGGELPVTWKQLQTFTFAGEQVHLVSQQGIFKPAQFILPISIRTTPPQVGREAPYDDEITDEGLLRYRFRKERDHSQNKGLREAMLSSTPMIYFKGIREGVYHASWPAFVVDDLPGERSVLVALLDPGEIRPDLDPTAVSAAERRYYTRLAKQRLHQASFRVNVLAAYRDRCTMCSLRHVELLDAAHIVSDRDGGPPVVQNGLAMCKIHHAAFDHQIVGIRPDHVVEVREDVLDEIDGPMLRHGLQEMHNTKIVVPRSERSRPNQLFLEQRYESFKAR